MSEVFNSNAAVLDTLLCSLMQIIRGAVIAKLLLQFYNATISEMSIVKNDDFSLKIKSSRCNLNSLVTLFDSKIQVFNNRQNELLSIKNVSTPSSLRSPSVK